MTLALVLDARWGICPCCKERHLWKKLREGGHTLWRTEHVTSVGESCKYNMRDWPTAVGELVDTNPEAVDA